MKKLFFLLILLPVVTFSQENLKKSAEDFVTGYFKLFEDKKWDEILNTYADDGLLIWPNSKIVPLRETMKPYLDKNKTEMTSEKVDIKWILTDVTGPNSAMVTTSYMDKTDKTGNIRITDNIAVFLLERKSGSWKIKKSYPQSNFPLIYNAGIDKKYQTDNNGLMNNCTGAIGQEWSLLCYEIENLKKDGVAPTEYGIKTGKRFAITWDKTKGYEGLVSGFTWGFQVMSTYVEVMEKNENTFKTRILSPTINKNWDVTSNELLIFTENVWKEIADFMGGTCTIKQDGKYWIVTMTKK